TRRFKRGRSIHRMAAQQHGEHRLQRRASRGPHRQASWLKPKQYRIGMPFPRGLVARSAYSHLMTQYRAVSSWPKRFRGMMTFGTPHNGLHYRIPFKTISTIALHGLSSRTITSIDRSLIYLHHRGRFAGIEDLQNPKNDDETFFARLRARERRT